MKNKRNKANNTNNANADIFSTVSILDGDEVVERNNNEYIYLDAERGIIAQPEEVETVKNRQAVDVLKNLLLGSFNSETGKYEISNNIELELKEIVKVETSHKGNAVFCESLSRFGGLGKLQFVVKTSVENSEALSQLFIFERVKKMSKTVINTQIQLIAEYKRYNETYQDFDSLTFENYYRFAWEAFKIVKQNQMFYLNEDEKFLQGWIIRRKLYLKSMGLILDPFIDAAESELLLTRIEILSGLGTYGYKVLERFEELKNQAQKIIGDGQLSARDQNEILEEAIETFRDQFEKEQTEFFKKQVDVVRDYAQTVANVKEQNHKEVLSDIEVRMPTVVEIIKRDDEAKKIGAMARLDAEVASIEANAKPTTKQVAENAKQAVEQANKNKQEAKPAQTAVDVKNKPAEEKKKQTAASAEKSTAKKNEPAVKKTTTTVVVEAPKQENKQSTPSSKPEEVIKSQEELISGLQAALDAASKKNSLKADNTDGYYDFSDLGDYEVEVEKSPKTNVIEKPNTNNKNDGLQPKPEEEPKDKELKPDEKPDNDDRREEMFDDLSAELNEGNDDQQDEMFKNVLTDESGSLENNLVEAIGETNENNLNYALEMGGPEVKGLTNPNS